MSPGFLSDKRAVVALIIAIPLSLIAILVIRPIDYNISLVVFGASLVLYLFACLLDTADEFMDAEEEAVVPAPADAHAESYVSEVEKPAARLHSMPVETIEGIGPVYGKLLREAGYPTVADLLAVEPERVAEICDVNAEQAERWIAMSRFAWLDSVSEEDAEAIVFATDIADLEALANAEADDILRKIRRALEEGDVRVPAGYEFDIARIRLWIEEAKSLI
jgi:predicted flap endonuclease-1-like 5' DNA nuclease